MTNESEMNRLRHKILTMLTFEERMYIQPLLDKCLMFATDESRPHGEWEWEEEWLPSTTEHPAECQYAEWRCNQCYEPPTDSYEWDDPYNKPCLRYCPNCGAKMQVKDELNRVKDELEDVEND